MDYSHEHPTKKNGWRKHVSGFHMKLLIPIQIQIKV